MTAKLGLQRLLIDYFLGGWNAAWAVFERITRTRAGGEKPVEVLVLRTAALGDFILSIPALYRLRVAYPKARITLLTTATTDQATLASVQAYARTSSPWLELLPPGIVDEIILLPPLGYLRALQSRRLPQLDGKKYDACFILNEGIGLKLSGPAIKLMFLRWYGVGCRIWGFRVRAYPKLFPNAQIGEKRLEHHVLALMRSIEEAPCVRQSSAAEAAFGLHVSHGSQRWARVRLAEWGWEGRDLLIIAPGSRLEFKRWPVEKFARVIETILEQSDVRVLLVGSGPEAVTVKQLLADTRTASHLGGKLRDLSGQITIQQLAALLLNAKAFLGNDGGACHLAAALNCRVISISNGAEIPNSVEPWGSQRFTARHKVCCSPCYCFTHCPKGENRCVTGISPDMVLRTIFGALAETGWPKTVR